MLWLEHHWITSAGSVHSATEECSGVIENIELGLTLQQLVEWLYVEIYDQRIAVGESKGEILLRVHWQQSSQHVAEKVLSSKKERKGVFANGLKFKYTLYFTVF